MEVRILTPALALTASLTLAACGTSTTGAPSTSPAPTAGGSSAPSVSESAAPVGSPSESSAPASATECPPVEGVTERVTQFSGPPPMCIDANKEYAATVTTDAGEFTIALDAEQAPTTVNNFVTLARYKFYDGTPFHRVIQSFMIQGGDPEGTGRGGPGYTIEDEFPEEGAYQEGSVAMANTGQPNSGGSQFFIVTGAAGAGLNAAYSLFGQVTEGMETVKKIEADGAPANDPTGQGVPATLHTITTVTITEK